MTADATALTLVESNRIERLATALGDVVSRPPEDPLAPECILVPGRAMSQWLNRVLSERFLIWSNALYLYPRNFATFALERVLDESAESIAQLDPDSLTWAVARELRPLLDRPEFEAVRRYVAGDESQVRYFELCQRIARVFDRYATYRPELLTEFEKAADGDGADGLSQLSLFAEADSARAFQRTLFRRLASRIGPLHGAGLERRFLKRLARGKTHLERLPSRICCFGVTSLPPSYTRILLALSRRIPVHVFQLRAAPSSGQPPSASEKRRRQNPLLASTEALAAEFDQVLAAELLRQKLTVERSPLHELPAGESRLARLQREIARDDNPDRLDPVQSRWDDGDDSVSLHACHSPMREVEVLHDQLMAVLTEGSEIEPRDIVVMTPDVESYAPLIEAVFRRRAVETHRIPFSIADRAVVSAAPVVDALGRVMDLTDQRLSCSQVLDLLSLDVVAARFDISPRDLEQVLEMVRAGAIRWGIDASHRTRHGHLDSDANTWKEGLCRLMLGYATDVEAGHLVLGHLPAGGLEGSTARVLGRLCHFVEVLLACVERLAEPMTPNQWRDAACRVLEDLFVDHSDVEWQHQEVRATLSRLCAHAERADFDEPIPPAAFRRLLFECVNQAQPASGFMSGGVTFCSMVPLRTIPFKVVCLLGLSDDRFPRRDQHLDFDLMARDPAGPRPGDRSRRNDDRYLFLEAVLSAREKLLITYTGQSIRDNAALPPSVLVSELSDYLMLGARSDEERARRLERLRISHPLQAFSPRYFDAHSPRLFSYESSYLPARKALRTPTSEHFFNAPLVRDEPAERDVAIDDLVRFFQGPTGYLLSRRLGLSLSDSNEELLDREPQELSPLDRFSVGQLLLDVRLSGASLAEACRVVRATQLLPQGTPGQHDLSEVLQLATPISEHALRVRAESGWSTLRVSRRLSSGHRLYGHLENVTPDGLLRCQFARVRAKHLIALWLRHVVYCSTLEDGRHARSAIVGRSAKGSDVARRAFRRIERPDRYLEMLIRLYLDGQREPLPFFPETSLSFATALAQKPDKPRAAWQTASREWSKELAFDANLMRVFGRRAALPESTGLGVSETVDAGTSSTDAARFDELAAEILQPLLDHLTEPDS